MLPCDQHIRGFGKDALYKSTFLHYVELHYLDLWPWTIVLHGGSRDQPCHQVWKYYAYLFLSYERHMHICNYAYNWKCVCGHWASTESRDQWVGGSKTITFFGILNPYLPIHYKTYMTTIKSHLCSSCPMLKQFSGAYFKVMLKWWFSGKMGV